MQIDPATRLSRRAPQRVSDRLLPRAGTLAGELRGGLSAAVVSLGILLPVGLLAFASLGTEAAALSIRAAFVAAIVGGAVSALVGGDAIPGSGPRTSTTLILAGFVASLVADPALHGAQGTNLEAIVALAAMCVTLAGALQVAFAALRLGTLVSYVPLPVVAGFMDGVAVLIIVSQIRVLAGVASFGVFAVAVGTAAVAWTVVRRAPRLPWALLAIVFGSILHWALAAMLAQGSGPLLGTPAPGIVVPLLSLSDATTTALHAHARGLVTTALVIAVIASLETLLAAAGLDTRLHTRHRPNRLLLGHGLGNIASGLLGGLPNATSFSVQAAAHRAGGRGRLSGLVTCALLLVAMLAGRNLIAVVPLAATVGVMLVVSLGMFDQWSRTVWRQLRAGQRDRDAMWSLATVAIVCAITVVFGFVVGIAVGVALSIALFVAAQNRSLVRSVTNGQTRSSRRIYAPAQAQVLRERGEGLRIVEVEGAIFFGTAQAFERELEKLAAGARFLVVDVRRVTMIDASGAHAFERLAARIRAKGAQFLLAGVTAGDRHARALHAHGAFVTGEQPFYPDIDHALEHAERCTLEEAGVRAIDEELPLARLPLLQGMSEAERTKLAHVLTRVELARGEVLFRRGEPGDRLYALAKGSVSILVEVDDGMASAHRLASFAPGVVFGEAAMLDGGGRTAGAAADEPSVVYVLTRAEFDALRGSDPALAGTLLFNVARELSGRLRFATATIQSADR